MNLKCCIQHSNNISKHKSIESNISEDKWNSAHSIFAIGDPMEYYLVLFCNIQLNSNEMMYEKRIPMWKYFFYATQCNREFSAD